MSSLFIPKKSNSGTGNVVFVHSKENLTVAQDMSSLFIPKIIQGGYRKCRLCSFQRESKRGAGHVIFVHSKENPRRVLEMVHPQNVRFQNVRFHNVRFQNVWNVSFTKRQLCKTSGLQNVRYTQRQVFKMSGCKKTSIYILYLWMVEISRFCCSLVCRQSEGCVLFSIHRGILPYSTIVTSNK